MTCVWGMNYTILKQVQNRGIPKAGLSTLHSTLAGRDSTLN